MTDAWMCTLAKMSLYRNLSREDRPVLCTLGASSLSKNDIQKINEVI